MNVLRQTVGSILEFFVIVMAEILTCMPDVVPHQPLTLLHFPECACKFMQCVQRYVRLP